MAAFIWKDCSNVYYNNKFFNLLQLSQLSLIYTYVHESVSFPHTQTHFTSPHLLPSQSLMPSRQVLPICSRGKHDENASLVVPCTDG